MQPLPPVTKFLLLFCTAVFCVQVLCQQLHLPFDQWLALFPVGSPYFFPWQVITYAFLHGGVFHLAVNMFGLWQFGSEMERLWGQKRYIQFLAVCTLSAAAAQLIIGFLGSPASTIGASGSIFGLLVAFGMLFPDRVIMLMIPPIPLKAKYFVIIYALIELYSGVYSNDGIAHFAHLGGAVGAYVMIMYWRGRPPFGGRRGGGGPRRMH